MKKLIFSILLTLSTLAVADEWKTQILLEKDVVELKIETSKVEKHKTLDVWSSPIRLQKKEQTVNLISVVTGCQILSGKIILFDDAGKNVTGEIPVDWSAKENGAISVIAAYTCAAAYRHGLVKKERGNLNDWKNWR